jgi:hypothetical protein
MPIHRDLSGEQIHRPYAWEYATQGTRESASGFTPDQVGKLARQLSDNSLWMLTGHNPIAWVAVGSALGGGGGVNAFAELVDTPGSYAGQAGRLPAVRSDETGLEFVTQSTGSGGGLEWVAISGSTTATVDSGYMMSGNITLTLPLGPAVGHQVGWKNISGTQTIARNGSRIEGQDEDVEIDIADAAGVFVFHGPDRGWVNVTEINGGGCNCATGGCNCAGGGGGGDSFSWVSITADSNADVNFGYLMHGNIILTLPPAPLVGDQVGWKNISGVQIIDRNGNKIEEEEENLTVDIIKAGGLLVYQGDESGWVNVTEINSGDGGGGGLSWLAISANTAAMINCGYMMSGDITLTLPLSPAVGDQVGWKNISGNQTIARNGSKIEGGENDVDLDIPGAAGEFVYQGSDAGWVNVTEINGGIAENIHAVTTTATGKLLSLNEDCTVTEPAQVMTLPASPPEGGTVTIRVLDFVNTVVDRNGEKIMGLDENFLIDAPNTSVRFTFISSALGWRL